MILTVGIVLTTYLGIRLGEKVKTKQLTQKKQKQQKTLVVKKEEENFKKYRKITIASMGLAIIGQFIYPALLPLSLGVIIYTTIPYMRQVEKALLKERKINVDVLFFTADMITLALNQYFTAALGIWMIYEGRQAVEKAQGRSKKIMTNIFDQQPRNVWILKDNVEIEIPLEDVKIDDILVINTGEVIASDGIIVDGFATIDQHALTGESQPVEKILGDQVLASTFIMTGKIHVKIEKSGKYTAIAKIGQILEDSTNFKSKIQLKGEEMADKATLPMFLLSAITFPIFGAASTVVFINSHMGVRVRIFAPLGTLNYITFAAHKGILIKDGRALESLNDIDTVVFDKTGTLTHEQPVVGTIILSDKYEENEILAYAAAAERKFSHPIAKAILQKAEDYNLILPDIDESDYKIGYGVTVNWDNKTVKVGSLRFMTMEGLSIPNNIKTKESELYNKGSSLVFVAINNKVSGAIEIQPQVRPEVEGIIAGLRQQGIKHLAIVSGDHQQPTKNLAEKLNMDDYYYDVLPENKAKIVEELQNKGHSVCFIGDGINDVVAMKKADVAISLSGATSIATDMADIVLMDGSLSHLCELFEISKKLDKNLQNTLLYSIIPGIINLSGAFLFHFSILTSFIINGASGLVTLDNVVQPLKKISNKDQ